MQVLYATYLLCAIAYAVLIALTFARPGASALKRYFLSACLGNAIWALIVAAGGLLPPSVGIIAGTASTVAWLLFLSHILSLERGPQTSFWRRSDLGLAAPILGIVTLIFNLLQAIAPGGFSPYWQLPLIGRLALAVTGIALVENFYRKTATNQRWTVRPLCIGLGCLFAFDLYLFSDSMLFRQSATPLLPARAIIETLIVPLLAMTMARSASWQVPIRVSRDAVFHSVTLIASGIFLLSVATIGFLFRRYGGEWSLILEVSLIFGAATILAVVLTSGTAKSYLRRFILENFFPYRYDYRVEWTKFIEMLSSDDGLVALPERVIRAIAEIVDSPGGVLFQLRDDAYVPTGHWNDRVGADAKEDMASAFIANFKDGRQIQQFQTIANDGSPPRWSLKNRFWIAVPLRHRDQLTGFVALLEPRASVDLDWEISDLLHTVAKQSASYLAERDTAAALTDARMFDDFNKRFAFVAHDIKNLASQLSLIVSNARRHGDDPEFQHDVMLTIENSVTRMNKLLLQLKAKEVSPSALTDISASIREIVSAHPSTLRIRLACPVEPVFARIEAKALHSAINHLLDNALDASKDCDPISVRVECGGDKISIDVSDDGPGMEMSFIRDGLFRPFRTTKEGGYGIGAFETQEIIRSAGGKLEVISAPGNGTTMRIILGASSSPVVAASLA